MHCRVIGPSGHRSEYHCATLLGNWQEERTSFGWKDPAREQMTDKTTYRDSYRSIGNEEMFSAKPPGCFNEEVPSELLFHHDSILDPPQRLLTVSELSYTNIAGGGKVNTLNDILNREGVSQRQSKSMSLRLAMGMSGIRGIDMGIKKCKGADAVPSCYGSLCAHSSNPDLLSATRQSGYKPPPLPPIGRVREKERFVTTKNATLDITGEYLKDNLEAYPATSTRCWGMFRRFTNDPLHRVKLREEYEN
ncbi:hypothetical protein ERJ75_001417300 [Trypanosoma vivax]|uniref:Uncharacterized protein n=1 Tax=Trypanosoma vivax (strain Y486) TaxID=1055687 RepID=G0TUH1_TRYVY|nr:hypothetical protein TRVL_03809 [Trypanosoma vivax]KAH8607382.1 hypothetical protein ERJ75_001417300 [Trypanosoma vivax]CCC47605.1 conserved hypothetical protein [Trypanosoma vivax Y486]